MVQHSIVLGKTSYSIGHAARRTAATVDKGNPCTLVKNAVSYQTKIDQASL